MRNEGKQVTVRALWPMPGTADGMGKTVSWGPHLAALVTAGRYEVLPDASGGTEREPPAAAASADTEASGAGAADAEAEPLGPVDGPGNKPVHRGRAR